MKPKKAAEVDCWQAVAVAVDVVVDVAVTVAVVVVAVAVARISFCCFLRLFIS